MNLTSLPHLARNANRVREVVAVLSRYGLADGISRLRLGFATRLIKGAQGQDLAALTFEQRVKLALTELGPTYVKLGQMLSTRPDLVGPALARELTELQDRTPADPFDRIKPIVEAELRRPLTEAFHSFSETPLASASIGQVHSAKLPDGRKVVVKVQHAAIEHRVLTDLDILAGLAELAEQYLPELKPYQPVRTVRDFARSLRRELDFNRERRHLEQFAAHFAKTPGVRFPAPDPERSGTRVLVMDQLEGVKLNDAQGLEVCGADRTALAKRGAEVFLEMIFRDGFFHADPHPGNLMVLNNGDIGILDCGMVGRLDETTREAIEDLLFAVVRQDGDLLTSVLTRLGSVPVDFDHIGLSNDVADFLGYYATQRIDRLDLGRALAEVVEIIRRYHLVLPAGVSLLIKVLMMLEGTSRLLNPTFNLTELIRPYQRKMVSRRLSPRRQWRRLTRLARQWSYLGERLPRGLHDVLQRLQSGRFDVHLEHQGLEPSVNRLVLGMMTSALFLGSALLWAMNVPPHWGGVPLPGVVGITASVVMGLRLLWAIRHFGRLD